MFRIATFLIALMITLSARAQTPTPIVIPDNVEIAMSLKSLPDGRQQVEWRFTDFSIPTPVLGITDHGILDVIAVPPSTYFHTWASTERVQKWIQTQGPSAEELDYLVKAGNGAEGGGFYTSLDSIDSAGFGDTVSIFRNDNPLLLADASNFVAMSYQYPKIVSRLNLKLRDLGIAGGIYGMGTFGADPISSKHGSWIDFYSNVGLRHAHAGTVQEVFEQMIQQDPRFDNILKLDQKFPLKPDELFRTKLPLAYKILMGEKLTDQEWNEWFPPITEVMPSPAPLARPQTYQQSFSAFMENASLLFNRADPRIIQEGGLAFTQALIKTETSRLRTAAIYTLGSDRDDFHQLATTHAPGTFLLNEFYGNLTPLIKLGFEDVFYLKSPFQMPSKLFLQGLKTPYVGATNIKYPFLANLEAALTFVDFPDLLIAISEGNPRPWTRYDIKGQKPMIDRYHEVRKLPFYGGSADDFKILLLQIHRSFSNSSEEYRGHGILAGGDLYPDKHGGFYRINEIERRRLLDNPFLSVEMKPDPEAKPPVMTYLARHRYPSVERFERYTPYFTPVLKAELESARASGVLKDSNSAEFKHLNQKMIGEMVDWAMQTYLGDFDRLYLILISIHPFRDFNGRSLRAMNAKFSTPIMLTDWDEDLFLSPPEFRMAVEVGNRKFGLLVDALEREQQLHPAFPRLYDLPEWFMIEENLEEMPADPAKWVQEQKARWRDPKLKDRVKHKRYRELPQTCDEILIAPPESS